jgi:hypothetical protein
VKPTTQQGQFLMELLAGLGEVQAGYSGGPMAGTVDKVIGQDGRRAGQRENGQADGEPPSPLPNS